MGRHWSTNASDDSLDSNGDGAGTGDRSPVSGMLMQDCVLAMQKRFHLT